MLVAVILGNKLNNDGSISETMRERLELALQIENALHPEKFILSGGLANVAAGTTEAVAMYEWLSKHGVPSEKLVLEDKSLSTKQNAKYSVPIAVKLSATQLLLCTTPEHMNRKFLNPIKLFFKQLRKYPNIVLKTCCRQAEIEKLS